MIQIAGYQKTTLLDYPGHVAATIFLPGCNYRCPFCHNSSLIQESSNHSISLEEILTFLKKRQRILEGVCITGGEPTLQKELPEFLTTIKHLGYQIKLDTNGSNPSMIKHLLKNNLVDYIAMDIKNSKANYATTIGIPNYDLTPIEETITLLKTSTIPYEFRTTLVKEYHTPEDIKSLATWLSATPNYYLQNFKLSDTVPNQTLHSIPQETLSTYLTIIRNKIPNAQLRGI